jgi:hypothetical protein
MTHPPGTIVLPLADSIRHSQFFASMMFLEQPEGTTVSIIRSASIAENTNAAIEHMTGEWCWLQSDDHVFGPTTLTSLLDCDVDIVVPVIYKRTPPFTPVLYRENGEQEWGGRTYPSWMPILLDELPDTGLAVVDGAGSGGMLIRKHVLDDIGSPWFENSPGAAANEDVLFCMKARDAGYRIHVALDTHMGHMGQFAIWPVRDADTGYTGWRVDLGNHHEIRGETRVPVA